METKEIEKKQYEMSFLVKEEDGAKTVLKFIKELGGDIELEGPVMKIALSYPISPAEVKHLEHEMETSVEILRHLIITPPFKKMEPRPRPEVSHVSSARVQAPRAPEGVKPEALTNEDLEKKIEEILG